MAAERERDSAADTRVPLKCSGTDSINRRFAPRIEVGVKCRPHARAKVVAEVKLPAAERFLRTHLALIIRICRKQPGTRVEIDIPGSEPPR